MAVFSLRKVQKIPGESGKIWSFFADPGNLPAITPPYMEFRILTAADGVGLPSKTRVLPPEKPGTPQEKTGPSQNKRIYAGQIIEYKLRPLPWFWVYWMTEITHVYPSPANASAIRHSEPQFPASPAPDDNRASSSLSFQAPAASQHAALSSLLSPPDPYFVDEQRRGPYRLWHHQHHFKPIPGGVEMTDLVHYEVPFGFIGSWANSLFVRKQLESLFEYRFKKVEEIFGVYSLPV